MAFIKYQHVEKWGTDEVEGIEIGEAYVFPKIDGTNGALRWEDGQIRGGSRRRDLTVEDDNQGFYNKYVNDPKFIAFFQEYPNVHLFGEFLKKHTIGTYKDDAWGNFYVFDVMDENGEYIHYNIYKLMLEKHDIEYIPPIAIITDGSEEQFTKCLEKSNYLIKDGCGAGEGIVIKRYGFKNKYGRTTWAKIVTSEFKERHVKVMGAPEIQGELTPERRFVDDFCTQAFVEKEYAKVAVDGWNSKMIPQLLGIIWHSFVTEHVWEALKKYKNPVIDFKKLNTMLICKVKECLPKVF